MKSQLQLQIAIQYPEIIALNWLNAKTKKTSELAAQPKDNKARLQIIENAVITFAKLVSPADAIWSVPTLKLCFMVLKFLQESQNR
ncbi:MULTISPECIES: hypothetical protein [Nostocaceae]|uniref:Uncharacterized protein n=1 Tax=Trichormus variabilis SAG 1403-4b TaxID=447716 RepID=A0A433UVB1_ANAVA|nr:hypothetical protein [Trichormus variabilis]MBD2627564.1 hypothetical protein [Trichormus variabilis FACHB-164]RUS97793.1 hypothetical protein DSM107003_16680 [Trichormus variabilis SAG 1403-4b]